ncbi:MAG: D-alanyl-D-alanine carboxypeptidase, partial [Verrucomicrobiales bacterium]|nr:D-alanyl-D-alanine carboxypeptidase [Verrucomicrobiales bacterium]
LLRYMDRHALSQEYREALPVAGKDGTLRSRFRGTPLEGNLRAKTGSLRYVHALAGWVTDLSGRRLVFAIMLNGYSPGPGAPSGREALDELVKRMTGMAVREEEAKP